MSGKKRLHKAAVEALQAEFPELPADYFAYMETVGWGEAASGRVVYSGPVTPASIYGERFAKSHIILLGDDMQGYCFGFGRDSKRFGEISDSGDWEPWPGERHFKDYVEAHDE